MNEVLLTDGLRHGSVPLISQMLCGKFYSLSEVVEVFVGGAEPDLSTGFLMAPSCPLCVVAAADLVRLLREG